MTSKHLIRALLIIAGPMILNFVSQSTAHGAEPPFLLPKDVTRISSAVIYTDYGDIGFELYPREAPWHCANFKYLADKGFYKNTKFHIFEESYIIQGGDPSGTGRGGPGYSLPPEFNDHAHTLGTLGMARSADYVNPGRDSHGSQFYIALDKAKHMNGQYTVFGQLTNGLEVLKQLRKGDKVLDIKVFLKPATP